MFFILWVGVSADNFLPVPKGGLTLHVSVTPSEIYRLKSIHRRIVWQLTQCFSAVTVVVDLPHGGKTYNVKRSDEPLYLLPPEKMSVFDRLELSVLVRKEMVTTIKMLQDHCSRRPVLRVVLLNHTYLEGINWFDAVFSDEFVQPLENVFRDARPDLPRSQRLFKNTAMYVWSMISCRSRLLLHFDIDTLGLYNNRPSVGASPVKANFVRLANQILVKNSSVLFVHPSGCDKTRNRISSSTSTRMFISHVERFRKMLPLLDWADHVENMLGVNLKRNNKFSAEIVARPCLASSYVTRKILKNSNWYIYFF